MNTADFNVETSSFMPYYMPRPRLDKILDQATRRKLVHVIAGTGYGKTQTIYRYIKQQQDAVVRWMQLTDSDNIGSRYWESLTHVISIDNPSMAAKLREFGFPETPARFKQLAEIMRTTEHRSRKVFIVFDDFHLIHSQDVLAFMERCVNLQIPGVCVIIISRKEPEINAISLIFKGKAGIITEEDLCFTAEETTEFFLAQSILLLPQDISRLMHITKGWALALNMFSSILTKAPNCIEHALSAMTQNILKFFEVEAWDDFPENVQKSIVKLSLLSDLPIASLQDFSEEAEFLQNAPVLLSFIWVSSFTGDLKINPIYLEFLQGKLDVLSDEEKQGTYRRAAVWCSENGFYIDAMRYYAKLQDFEHMIKLLFTYPFKLPRDASECFLEILGDLKQNSDEESSTSVLFLKNFFEPLLMVGAGRYEEARNRSLSVIQEWEHIDTPLSMVLLYTSYSHLAYIDMYNCTFTHKYDGPEHLRKSVEYFKLSTIPPVEVAGAFVNADIRSFACLVGAGAGLRELEQFLDAAKQVAIFNEETAYTIYAGYEDLVACEYAFFKNQPDTARYHAHKAILRAREAKQYSIVALAEKYLLRMAAQEGNYQLSKEILKHMQSYLDNTDFWNRQLYYDLYTGTFFAQLGLSELVPKWIVMDEKDMLPGIKIPAREIIATALYYISAKKYQQALTILRNSYPREPQEQFLFGEIRISLLTAVALIRSGDTAGALKAFEKAYAMSFEGKFEMFFIELGKELHPLVVAAMKSTDCSIPEEWLKTIDRKASIYSKKITVIANALKREYKIEDSISLSEREHEVLSDLYHGLSREEIAENRYLSINTVKKTLQSIYTKLDANSNVEAIRIALEKKLIE